MFGIYTGSLNGHRQSYLDFVKKKFGGERINGKKIFFTSDVVFFLMVEDNFILYFLVCFIRSLCGKNTVGLLFRPKPVLNASNFKLKLKFIILKLLKNNTRVQTLSIVPEILEPSISEIVDDWIYDFQLWDITKKQRVIFHKIRKGDIKFGDFEKYKIANEIKMQAKNKKILIALGAQNKCKGIHVLSEHISKFNQEKFVVVVAGCFDEASAQQKKYLQDNNALIFDRFMTDEEILALYSIADAVWCYYDPSYDQASGILGRSIQLGVLPIVRPNSLSEKFCKKEKIRYIAPNFDNNELIEFDLNSGCNYFEKSEDISSRLENVSQIKIKKSLKLSGDYFD